MPPIVQPVIDRIKMLLLRKRWSGRELERKASLSPGYVSQLLRGKRVPSLYTLARVEKALGAPVLSIAGRKPERTVSGQLRARGEDSIAEAEAESVVVWPV